MFIETILYTTAVCATAKASRRQDGAVLPCASISSGVGPTCNLFSTIELSLEDLVAYDLDSISGVSSVSCERAGNVVRVSVQLENMDYEVRQRIYSKELELINEFPQYNFDVDLIPATA